MKWLGLTEGGADEGDDVELPCGLAIARLWFGQCEGGCIIPLGPGCGGLLGVGTGLRFCAWIGVGDGVADKAGLTDCLWCSGGW